ncbi:Alpha/Beta hydrolase protein [Endogone sp. FLAS-F59071]|nr:Alpha/Beta hydrolase protein [Endogone sp. FLAS-F59071]|eukprot:RUS20570.1 Alpha/Beta hydrolase protein [Endogone sp. FLAS-F59071]
MRFFESFQEACSTVFNSVTEQVNQYGYNVVLTGHSLGAALTVLQALDFYQNAGYDSSTMSVYTYGEPRVGDPSFSAYVDSLGLSIYRTINENDLVPHLAPESFGYMHHGIEYWIGDSAGDVLECVTDEDYSCADSTVPFTSISAHLKYWK